MLSLDRTQVLENEIHCTYEQRGEQGHNVVTFVASNRQYSNREKEKYEDDGSPTEGPLTQMTQIDVTD